MQKLRKIVSLTIFCVTCDFSQFFLMLTITKPDRIADWTKFAKIAKKSQFWRFPALLAISHSSLSYSCSLFSSSWSLSLKQFADFDDFPRYLRFLTVLCHVHVHFSRLHDHLSLKQFADFTKFAISPKSFHSTCHFGISLSVQLKHVIQQKPKQLFK